MEPPQPFTPSASGAEVLRTVLVFMGEYRRRASAPAGDGFEERVGFPHGVVREVLAVLEAPEPSFSVDQCDRLLRLVHVFCEWVPQEGRTALGLFRDGELEGTTLALQRHVARARTPDLTALTCTSTVLRETDVEVFEHWLPEPAPTTVRLGDLASVVIDSAEVMPADELRRVFAVVEEMARGDHGDEVRGAVLVGFLESLDNHLSHERRSRAVLGPLLGPTSVSWLLGYGRSLGVPEHDLAWLRVTGGPAGSSS